MNIVEIKERKNTVVAALLRIWESSVKATHLFLSEKEIEKREEALTIILAQLKQLQSKADENHATDRRYRFFL